MYTIANIGENTITIRNKTTLYTSTMAKVSNGSRSASHIIDLSIISQICAQILLELEDVIRLAISNTDAYSANSGHDDFVACEKTSLAV